MAIAVGQDVLIGVGLAETDVARWTAIEPRFAPPDEDSAADTYDRDVLAARRFFEAGQSLFERLPPRPRRSAGERLAADMLQHGLRQIRLDFLRRHTARLYAHLTQRRS